MSEDPIILGLTYDNKLSNNELVRSIEFIISREYETAQRYMHLANVTENKRAQNLFKNIADQERIHAAEFTQLLDELSESEKKK